MDSYIGPKRIEHGSWHYNITTTSIRTLNVARGHQRNAEMWLRSINEAALMQLHFLGK